MRSSQKSKAYRHGGKKPPASGATVKITIALSVTPGFTCSKNRCPSGLGCTRTTLHIRLERVALRVDLSADVRLIERHRLRWLLVNWNCTTTKFPRLGGSKP